MDLLPWSNTSRWVIDQRRCLRLRRFDVLLNTLKIWRPCWISMEPCHLQLPYPQFQVGLIQTIWITTLDQMLQNSEPLQILWVTIIKLIIIIINSISARARVQQQLPQSLLEVTSCLLPQVMTPQVPRMLLKLRTLPLHRTTTIIIIIIIIIMPTCMTMRSTNPSVPKMKNFSMQFRGGNNHEDFLRLFISFQLIVLRWVFLLAYIFMTSLILSLQLAMLQFLFVREFPWVQL